MKIAQVYDEFPMPYTSYVEFALNKLKTRSDLYVEAFAFRPHGSTLKTSVSQKINNKLLNLAGNQRLTPAVRNIVNSNFDIIHIQISYLYNKFLPVIDDKDNKTKFILTLRGGDTYIKPWLHENWRSFYKDYGNKIFFVTMCEEQKEYLTKFEVPRDRIFVVPISHNNNTNVNYSRKLKDRKSIKIISAFRMTWEKNVPGNLLFIKKLIEKGYNVQYDIYGDGDQLGEALYLIDVFNLHQYVNICGKVSHDELLNKMLDYHFTLQMSVTEGIPGSIIEAQSMGIPAIIADSGGLPESIDVHRSGICVPFWEIDLAVDKTISLWTNEALYENFCENSVHHAQKFSVDNEVESLIKMYQNIKDR